MWLPGPGRRSRRWGWPATASGRPPPNQTALPANGGGAAMSPSTCRSGACCPYVVSRPGRRHGLALAVRPVRLDHPLVQLTSRGCCGWAARCSTSASSSCVGHVIGLLVPESWTDAAGVREAYHVQAPCSAASPASPRWPASRILIYRRRTTGPVFMATTRNDKVMYVVLVAAILAGLTTTLLGATGGDGARLPAVRVAVVPVAVRPAARTSPAMARAGSSSTCTC